MPRLLRTPREVAQARFDQAAALWRALPTNAPSEEREAARQVFRQASRDAVAARFNEILSGAIRAATDPRKTRRLP